ncbi:MAG: hypothetical protein QW303_03930 [Nitrososphaerota archaeon]
MELKEFVLMFGIFLISFYACSSFLISFSEEIDVPEEITYAWNASTSQITDISDSINNNINSIRSGGLNAVLGTIGLAFSGIYFIIVSLWSIFIQTPIAIYGGMNYIASSFSIPSEITLIIFSIIGTIILFKLIQFITGREI